MPVAPHVRTAAIGWILVVVFGLLVFAIRGTEELFSALLFAGIALLMLVWLWRRPGRAALVTSLVLGLLHTIEQVAYLFADLTSESLDALVVAGDAEGLVAGIVIVVGSVAALRTPATSRATAAGLP